MNNIIIQTLGKKKLQVFFLFYMILLLPILTTLADNLSLISVLGVILINILLFISIVVLSVFCSSRLEKIIYSVIFIVSCLPFLIYTSYLLFAGVLLQKNSIISLFETNPEESKEFLANYFNPWIIVACLAYVLICFLIIWIMTANKRLKIKDHKYSFYASLCLLLVILITPSSSKAVYFVNFYRMYINYRIDLKDEQLAISERQNLPYELKTRTNDTIPQTIVVAIGESLTRNHMSLYGYERNTNPMLSKLGDSLFVYQDVVSPQVHTIPVMRTVLTLFERDTPENITEKPSLFELFNRAGYETYFISNQPFQGKFNTSYDALLSLSKNIYNVSVDNLQDEVVLPYLKDILADKSKKHKLILIHLIGNHMAYEFRYTPSFKKFNNDEDNEMELTSFRDNKAILTIDKYDNSVLYNDSIIASMISILKQEYQEDIAFVYFSDHGEEVYDSRKFAGHAYEKASTYMCEIPFLVWLSPLCLQKRSDLVIDPKRSFSTSDFLQSLSNLAGIEYADYKRSKSLFSPDFETTERFIGSYTYEELLNNKQ